MLGARVDPTDAWTSADEAAALAMLTAASRMVEEYTGREFATTSSETRYYTPLSGTVCEVDDCRSVSALYTDVSGSRDYGVTWATTDYDLLPFGADAHDRPFTEIALAPLGRYEFTPGLAKSVKLTAVFGWPEVPAPVIEAVMIEAGRMLAQTQSPSGVVASAELGRFLVMPELHPTSRILLAPFRRFRMVAA